MEDQEFLCLFSKLTIEEKLLIRAAIIIALQNQKENQPSSASDLQAADGTD